MNYSFIILAIIMTTIATTRYKQFPGGDQNQKPLLYIGGIFPISASTKFTAPELVPGEGNHIIMIWLGRFPQIYNDQKCKYIFPSCNYGHEGDKREPFNFARTQVLVMIIWSWLFIISHGARRQRLVKVSISDFYHLCTRDVFVQLGISYVDPNVFRGL